MNSFNSAFTALQSNSTKYFYFTDSTGKQISPKTISNGYKYFVFDTAGSKQINIKTNVETSITLYYLVVGGGQAGTGGQDATSKFDGSISQYRYTAGKSGSSGYNGGGNINNFSTSIHYKIINIIVGNGGYANSGNSGSLSSLVYSDGTTILNSIKCYGGADGNGNNSITPSFSTFSNTNHNTFLGSGYNFSYDTTKVDGSILKSYNNTYGSGGAGGAGGSGGSGAGTDSGWSSIRTGQPGGAGTT